MKRGNNNSKRHDEELSGGFEAPRSYDWNAFRCRMLWCYQGTPATTTGSFETVNFIVWHLLEGGVEITSSGPPLRAAKGSWVVMIPGLGRRTQSFQKNSKIISIHFSVESSPAKWQGPSAVAFPGDAELLAAAEALVDFARSTQQQGSTPGGPILSVSSFEEQLEVQLKIWRFWAALAPQLSRAGVNLRAPDLTDPVMAKSMALIEAWPMNAPWDRGEVSRVAGVSASQLDRKWRETCGQTPFQYWSQRRLLYACSQLQNMERGVKAIAYDLGFAHLSQFSNWFRRYQDTSPRTYRYTFSG